ncbi:MAG: type II toxin-antitoxin system RelE/ParE family toxin [Micrococcus sp.]|nr:type II toxin-antitoxin system RelE/ParE family toxin [Micrococcus sp.]
MGRQVEYSPRAGQALRQIDRQIALRVIGKLDEVAVLDDPTVVCTRIQGPLGGPWQIRVEDFRVIVDGRRDAVVMVAVDVGHRSSV